MDAKPHAAGLAALAICESLLLSLAENGILADGEARNILEDAAAANRNAAPLAPGTSDHGLAASIIDSILAGQNSVRFK